MTVLDMPGVAEPAARPSGRLGDDRVVGDLLRLRTALAHTDPRRRLLRHRAVAAGVPTAVALARRYAGRGSPMEDLRQVAILGLVKAINSYDPGKGTEFWAYAMPTIAGELKHHFRDSGWAVRVPRRCKELQHRMNRSRDLLIQRLRRMPGPADFAEHLGTGTDEVIQALRAENGYDTTPLTLAGGTAGPDRPPHGLGVSERGYELVELREVINHALTRVSRRERSAIVMRYFGEMTQAEIGAELGMSQVAVSRLLARTLRRLRRHVRDTR